MPALRFRIKQSEDLKIEIDNPLDSCDVVLAFRAERRPEIDNSIDDVRVKLIELYNIPSFVAEHAAIAAHVALNNELMKHVLSKHLEPI